MDNKQTTHSGKHAGVLFVVATPLGNLEDISARALRILREADVVAAEDTRVSRKLLAHFDIHTPLVSYHAHTTDARENALVERLLRGENIALVSDAGTPGISDPGADLIAAAIAQNIPVEPVPGPSAVIAALVASGLPTGRFVFEGFLPRTRADYRARLDALGREERTVILYEAPMRLTQTLDDLIALAGPNRRACVAREITKKFEEFVRGTLAEVRTHFEETAPRGECVVVLEGIAPGDFAAPETETVDVDALLREAIARGLSSKDAAREVARTTGLARRDLYARAIALSDAPE